MTIDKHEQEIQEFALSILQMGFNSEDLLNFLVNKRGLHRNEAQKVVDAVKARLLKGERVGA